MFYYDSTYILIFAGIALVMFAQTRLKSVFSKYSHIPTTKGVSGREAASLILQANQIHDVSIEPIAGQLTDHYDPRSKVLRLSEATYQATSVAAVAVAAHECGHAVQHAKGYSMMKLRSALVPITSISSQLGGPVILAGFIFQMMGLVRLGIILLLVALAFQLVTLPVEFDASKRAVVALQEYQVFDPAEIPMAKKVLGAAAFTYVAGTLSSALQILRLIILSNRRND